jgi:O-antigen/teichoic acid export membrane protein
MHDSEVGSATRGGGWWRFLGVCGTATDRRNQLHAVAWLFVWAVCFVAATWILKHGEPAWPLRILAVALPVAIGWIAFLRYRRFLREADELTRRIQLEGLAIGFATGVMFAPAYWLAELAGAPPLDLGDVAAVMMVAWAAGQLVAQRRFW